MSMHTKLNKNEVEDLVRDIKALDKYHNGIVNVYEVINLLVERYPDVDSLIQPDLKKNEVINKLATDIVELFEELLDNKGIEIPCEDQVEQNDRHDGNNDAKLYGMEYHKLVESVQELLENDVELLDFVNKPIIKDISF